MKMILLVLSVFATLLGTQVYADVTLSHTDRAAFRSGGFSKLDNYSVRALNTGAFLDPPVIGAPLERERNYHTFDLSEVAGTVTTATLRVWVDAVDAVVGSPYQSSDPSETVNLFDVSASAETLLNPTSENGGPTVFDDLGTGEDYGALVVNSTDASTYIDVALTGAAISDLNAAVGIGSWSVGGALDFNGSYGANSNFISERVFHDDNIFTNDMPTLLVLTGTVVSVPEPSSLFLLALGVGALCSTPRRNRR